MLNTAVPMTDRASIWGHSRPMPIPFKNTPRTISINQRTGAARRYCHVLYHNTQQEPVDVIVYRGRGFVQPWFLVVPPDSEDWLPTETLVALYRQRMQIEHCFRDWKSHLGLRGLHLQVHIPERLLRLLMRFTLAYLFTLLLGGTELAERARPFFELRRRRPRHRTSNTLSVLSIAILMLTDARWQQSAQRELAKILSALIHLRDIALPGTLPP